MSENRRYLETSLTSDVSAILTEKILKFCLLPLCIQERVLQS